MVVSCTVFTAHCVHCSRPIVLYACHPMGFVPMRGADIDDAAPVSTPSQVQSHHLLLLLLGLAAVGSDPTTYTWPADVPRSAWYSVTVNGEPVDVLEHQSFSWFSFESAFTARTSVQVVVVPLDAGNQRIASAVVRPLRHNVQAELDNNNTAEPYLRLVPSAPRQSDHVPWCWSWYH